MEYVLVGESGPGGLRMVLSPEDNLRGAHLLPGPLTEPAPHPDIPRGGSARPRTSWHVVPHVEPFLKLDTVPEQPERPVGSAGPPETDLEAGWLALESS